MFNWINIRRISRIVHYFQKTKFFSLGCFLRFFDTKSNRSSFIQGPVGTKVFVRFNGPIDLKTVIPHCTQDYLAVSLSGNFKTDNERYSFRCSYMAVLDNFNLINNLTHFSLYLVCFFVLPILKWVLFYGCCCSQV